MRNLHDEIMIHGLDGAAARQKTSEDTPTQSKRPRLRQSSFVNTMDMIEAPWYASLGFIEGAFSPHVVNETEYERNSTSIERNITECRINSIRFVNNLTYYYWYLELDYGIDRKMLFGTDSISSSYPFSLTCFYAVDEAIEIATSSHSFTQQGWQELIRDTVYEMRSHTDAVRRIYKLMTEIYAERKASGTGLRNKDYYAIGQQLGLIFNNIST